MNEVVIAVLLAALFTVPLVVWLLARMRARRRAAPTAGAKASDDLAAVAKHLKSMGYDLTPYGGGVALAQLASGYNVVEAASHLAHVTLARDVRDAGDNIEKLVAFVPHGMALIEVLTQYKDAGAMHPTQWQNDARAVMGIITVDEQQEKWLTQVLSDPVAGAQRVATSRL